MPTPDWVTPIDQSTDPVAYRVLRPLCPRGPIHRELELAERTTPAVARTMYCPPRGGLVVYSNRSSGIFGLIAVITPAVAIAAAVAAHFLSR